MADFHIKVNKMKPRLRDTSRTLAVVNSDTNSVNSSRYNSSFAASTDATSVSSGISHYTESVPQVPAITHRSNASHRPSAIIYPSPKDTSIRPGENNASSPLDTLMQKTRSMMSVASDSSLTSSRTYTIGGPPRPTDTRRPDVPQRTSSDNRAQERSAYKATIEPSVKESASHRAYREKKEARSKRESAAPTASMHFFQPRQPEDREPAEYGPEPVKVRRRSSIQVVKEAVEDFTETVKDKATKVRKRLSSRIEKALAPRETRPTDIHIIAKNDPDVNTSPKAKNHRLPTAAEVYGKPTSFAKCPHESPPAHLPLNDVPRTVRHAEGVLRYPTFEQRQVLNAMKNHPDVRAPTVEIVDGRCATCDLQNRRKRETAVIHAWNEKHDIFAQRLKTRRINYRHEWGSGFHKRDLQQAGREVAIEALENKLIEVNKNREIAVAAVWRGFRERWGVSPTGIVPQKEKMEWEYGRTTPPLDPPREDEVAKRKDQARQTGYMRDGKFGGPMDYVDEPGRVRLQWCPKDTNMPDVPVRYKQWQDLTWTAEETALLYKDPWET